MSLGDFLTLATLALAVLLVTPFLGRYIHRVMEGERTFLSPVLRPVERVVYRVCGIDETAEQGWKGYAVSRPRRWRSSRSSPATSCSASRTSCR